MLTLLPPLMYYECRRIAVTQTTSRSVRTESGSRLRKRMISAMYARKVDRRLEMPNRCGELRNRLLPCLKMFSIFELNMITAPAVINKGFGGL